jgi:hypothetical protein
MNRESESVNEEEVEAWETGVLPSLLSECASKDIFNADGCELFFSLLSDKTCAFKGENCHGSKRSKDRISVLVGTDMDGSEKMPLLVIRKSQKPRCFNYYFLNFGLCPSSPCFKTTTFQGMALPSSSGAPTLVGPVDGASLCRCFKHVKFLPYIHRHDSSASVSCTLFVEFLTCLEWRMAAKHWIILLFVDQYAADPKYVDKLRNV